MMRDVVSVLLLVLAFLLSPTPGTTLECREGEVELQGGCESCQIAILARLTTGENCPQCPDVTKRGLHCDVHCSKLCADGCERWTGHCHRCKKDLDTGRGRWGDQCKEECPQNCKDTSCHKIDGTCLDGCKDGYFGVLCDHHCHPSCPCENGNTCTNPPCTQEGNCVYNCTEGYYGEHCTIPCPAGCSSHSCTREGKCHACTQGSYGDQCQLPCSDHCTDKQCHQHTGVCSHGCEAGFWGDTCVSACPDSCVSCTNSTDCPLCEEGWDGTACQHRCRGHCLGGCDDSGQCKQCKDGFYGVDCNKTCSQNCVSLTDGPGACNRSSGHCLHGCKNGFFGPRCDAECSDHCVDRTCQGQFPENGGTCVKGCKDGYRGVYCQVPCPDHCQTCSQRDVGCGQCQDGWYSSVCQERCQNCSGSCHKDTGNCTVAVDATQNPGTESMQAIALGLTVTLVLLILLLVLVSLLFLRKRYLRRKRSDTNSLAASCDPLINVETLPPPCGITPIKIPGPAREGTLVDIDYTLPDVVPPKSTLIPLDRLAEHDKDMRKCMGYRLEFQTLPTDKLHPCNAGTRHETIPKNRYKNIIAYDHTLVVLSSDYQNCAAEYINANFIDGYNCAKKFIATQGPFQPYICDFWKMVRQENVRQIIMLTNLVENGKSRCEKYWPDEHTQAVYGDFTVECTQETAQPCYCVRNFVVTTGASGSPLQVRQYHYQTWPDMGVPSDHSSILAFWDDVTRSRTPGDGPIVIHCSAGIGRTGTIIGLDWLLEQAQAEGAVDVYSCVLSLRHQRFHMVQTVEQYEFLHQILLTALKLE